MAEYAKEIGAEQLLAKINAISSPGKATPALRRSGFSAGIHLMNFWRKLTRLQRAAVRLLHFGGDPDRSVSLQFSRATPR